jgi:hypothetical protein
MTLRLTVCRVDPLAGLAPTEHQIRIGSGSRASHAQQERRATQAALEFHLIQLGGSSRGRSCGEASHCLTELRVDFVCDRHDSNQQ